MKVFSKRKYIKAEGKEKYYINKGFVDLSDGHLLLSDEIYYKGVYYKIIPEWCEEFREWIDDFELNSLKKDIIFLRIISTLVIFSIVLITVSAVQEIIGNRANDFISSIVCIFLNICFLTYSLNLIMNSKIRISEIKNRIQNRKLKNGTNNT